MRTYAELDDRNFIELLSVDELIDYIILHDPNLFNRMPKDQHRQFCLERNPLELMFWGYRLHLAQNSENLSKS